MSVIDKNVRVHDHSICEASRRKGVDARNEENAHFNWWHCNPPYRYLSEDGEWDFYFNVHAANWIEVDGEIYSPCTCSNGFPYTFSLFAQRFDFEDGGRKFKWINNSWCINVPEPRLFSSYN